MQFPRWNRSPHSWLSCIRNYRKCHSGSDDRNPEGVEAPAARLQRAEGFCQRAGFSGDRYGSDDPQPVERVCDRQLQDFHREHCIRITRLRGSKVSGPLDISRTSAISDQSGSKEAAKPFAIAVTSAGPAEGKSALAAAVAKQLRTNGARVLLIDADIRRPGTVEVIGRRRTARSDRRTAHGRNTMDGDGKTACTSFGWLTWRVGQVPCWQRCHSWSPR